MSGTNLKNQKFSALAKRCLIKELSLEKVGRENVLKALEGYLLLTED